MSKISSKVEINSKKEIVQVTGENKQNVLTKKEEKICSTVHPKDSKIETALDLIKLKNNVQTNKENLIPAIDNQLTIPDKKISLASSNTVLQVNVSPTDPSSLQDDKSTTTNLVTKSPSPTLPISFCDSNKLPSTQIFQEKQKSNITLNRLVFKLSKTITSDANNLLSVEKPDIIIFRLFDVLSSYRKTFEQYCNFTQLGLGSYLKRNWVEPYIIQLVEDLRIEASNDHSLFSNSPLISKWNHTSLKVQQSVIQYMQWKFLLDGGYSVGNANLPHNQLQKLYWHYLMKSGKIQLHLYPEVRSFLKKMKLKTDLILLSCCTAYEITGDLKLTAFTQYGDITSFFTQFLDTGIYNPIEEQGFKKIIKLYGNSKKILFLTANPLEARLAKKYNINPLLVLRDDSLSFDLKCDSKDIPTITSLSELKFC